jgi:cardiolipin synthase A/B
MGLRAGLRRHGLVPRPAPIRALLRQHDLRFTEGNRVVLFERGRPALGAMLEAVRAARERVHLETYILHSDTTGRRFLDVLAARAREGVAVRLLYDALGSRGIAPEPLAVLRRAGGDVVAFNPLHHWLPRWIPRRRDHRKILTVDGVVAFTGGLNVGDEYYGLNEDGSDGWHDAHLEIRGPAVRDLDAVFLESWFRADGPELPWHAVLGAPAPPEPSGVRCAVLADGPVYRRRRMRDLVIELLESATRRACFASPYFAPGRTLLQALAAAGRRGVRVDLLVAGQPSDHPWLRRAARAFYPPLLDCGVRIHEFQGAMMHAKLAVLDTRLAVVGTSNLDRQSLQHSYEVNVVLADADAARGVEASFERYLESSARVDAAALSQRGPLDRLLDGAAAVLARAI